MSGVSNRQVVEELRAGNREGCAHLVELYQRLLIHEGIRTFHMDPRDAEEVVSDTLLTIVQKIGQFTFRRSEQDFHYWVMAVFRNRVRDFLRHTALTQGLESVFVDGEGRNGDGESEQRAVVIASLRDYENSLAEEREGEFDLVHRGRLEFLMEALDRMETWERVLIRCRALNVPFEEIARFTGKPVSQLKVYHARVKRKLVRVLAERFPELNNED